MALCLLDCAAGFVYTIVHANEYHGQNAGAVQPLMKFGLTSMAEKSANNGLNAPPIEKKLYKTITPVKGDQDHVIKCAVEVKEVLDVVNNEFEELGFFQKNGLSVLLLSEQN